jgi:hypothetical protein
VKSSNSLDISSFFAPIRRTIFLNAASDRRDPSRG